MTNIYIIYEIRPINKELIYSYVGSTKNFIKRKSNHKKDYNDINRKASNRKIYEYIRANGGWDEFEIIPLEECECDSKIQARIREQFFINQIENKLNMKKAYRTIAEKNEYKKEYRIQNKEKNEEVKKIYRIEKKLIIAENKKLYNAENKEKIKEQNKKYQIENKEKNYEMKKIYREVNKEKIAEQRKKYLIENKEKVAKQRKEYRLKNKKNKLASVNAESN
jgi:hypothetical protein